MFFYRVWNFIKYVFNKIVSLFKFSPTSKVKPNGQNTLSNEVENAKEVVEEDNYDGHPFGTVVAWSDSFISQCTSSNGINWPRSSIMDAQFERRIKRQDRLLKKYQPREPLRLYLSKQIFKYFERARSVVYDTTDYFLKKAFKFKNKFKSSLSITGAAVPIHERNNNIKSAVTYNSVEVAVHNNSYTAWYECVSFVGSFENTCIDLNKSYYVANGFSPIICTYGNDIYSSHYTSLYSNRYAVVLIKCDNFDKFEHFLLFLRYEINIAIKFEQSKNIIAAIDDEYEKSHKCKLPFFTTKNKFKNKFKKCLSDDYDLYAFSSVDKDMYKLPLSMFFRQAVNKEEVLTYEMFNVFKSFGDDTLLNEYGIGYRVNDNDFFKTLRLKDDRRDYLDNGIGFGVRA